MMTYRVSICVLLLAAGFSLAGCERTVEYKGEKFKAVVSDGALRLDPSEFDRVEEVMTNAAMPVGPLSREAMRDAISDMRFPLLGSSRYPPTTLADGSQLRLHAVEIPDDTIDKDRYFTVHEANGESRLIDDFIWSSPRTSSEVPPTKAQLEGGLLRYRAISGEVVLEREPRFQLGPHE